MITKKVVLVKLSNSISLNKGEIQNRVNEIFAQGVVQVEMEEKTFETTAYDGGIDSERDHYRYSGEMKGIVAAFKKTTDYSSDRNTVYLFFGNATTGGASASLSTGLEGVMNRGARFGFIFNHNNANVIAHELGHGLFALQHTEDDGSGGKGEGNLMGKNSTGFARLYKYQWAYYMRNPPPTWKWVEDRDDAELKNRIFFTPDWKPFRVPSPPLMAGVCMNSDQLAARKNPQGTVFAIYDSKTKTTYTSVFENGAFVGYKMQVL